MLYCQKQTKDYQKKFIKSSLQLFLEIFFVLVSYFGNVNWRPQNITQYSSRKHVQFVRKWWQIEL